jgi:hypothetical protein
MHVTDVKLLCDSDSQVKAAKYLKEQGFRVAVRFYHQARFPEGTPRAGQFDDSCLAAVPDDILKGYAPYIWAAEGYINEPEIEWNKMPNETTIDLLAKAYVRFADACGRNGITPVTPAIQGDRVYSWFEPFVKRVIELGWKDRLLNCFIGCHPRPVNNLPDAPAPGFVVNSYKLFAAVCDKYDIPKRLLGTEFGYEPGDDQNKELPKIDHQSHAVNNVYLAGKTYDPCLEVGYFWTWLPDWSDSGWWRGSVADSLPVVQDFIAMVQPIPPEPPLPPEPPAIPADLARKAADLDMQDYPWGIKWSYRHGMVPFGSELPIRAGDCDYWYAQPAFRVKDGVTGLVLFPEGGYTDEETEFVEWTP